MELQCDSFTLSNIMTDLEIMRRELPLEAAEGKSLPDAIREKYFDDEPLSGMILGGVSVVSNLPSMKDSSSGKVRLPQCLSLNYSCIVGAGAIGEVETLCKDVKELDLAENNLSEWNEVLSITTQIPQLKFLNLSSNPLSRDLPPELTPITSLATITSLVLNNTKIPWQTLHTVLDSTPTLEQLHLSLNDHGRVSLPNRSYTSVKLLQFNRNQITKWQEVSKLGKMFPNLESLFLSENNLTGLSDCIGEHFSCLQSLCVSETGIGTWEEIDALNSFPSLTEIRLTQIPLLEHFNETERRQLTLARLARVTRLNGSRIKDPEREAAERALIRFYMNQQVKPQRYHDLVAVYGTLSALAEVDLRPKTKVTCNVSFEDKVQKFEINLKQTCSQFKQSLQDFVGLPSSKFNVFLSDPEVCYGPDRMQFPSKMLYTYKIRDDHEFIVISKP
ncbi:tubulin-specific chaperone cofactor E-like protein [Asterias rubens]|uniref:tubulin-specific chaperone cofactor E-like protein n=1 Tax=Asterias rubens TaxID=7604 RepID=UPI0014554B50|nr:tubulin-specific chaperone cofactor E-like protein [Asterias rubens]